MGRTLLKTKRVRSAEGHKLEIALKNLDGKVGKVGWFEKSKYDDPEKTPVAYVAAINEYGYPPHNIPARPFMRPTIIEKQNEWARVAKQGAMRVIKGEETIGDVMETLGLLASGQIKKKIASITEPELKPATIAARLHRRSDNSTVGLLTKPLIDTKVMYLSLTNTVEDA